MLGPAHLKYLLEGRELVPVEEILQGRVRELTQHDRSS